MALFDEQQKQQIAQAVARAEQATAGELVVVETPRSDDYSSYRSLVALALTILITHEMTVFFPAWPSGLLMALQLPLAIGLYSLAGTAICLRWIVPRAAFRLRTEQRALRAFLEAGVSETRDRSGVLIFLSAAEHRAVILADKGINDRVEAGEWQRDLEQMVDHLRRGEATVGLLKTIDRVGTLLGEAFPRRTDDTNELTDEVRTVP